MTGWGSGGGGGGAGRGGGGGGVGGAGDLFGRGTYHGGISSDLEYKVEKLKYKKLEVMEPRIKNKST